MNGDLTDADRDRLITTDSDGTYRKYPGVNNIAYVVSLMRRSVLFLSLAMLYFCM